MLVILGPCLTRDWLRLQLDFGEVDELVRCAFSHDMLEAVFRDGGDLRSLFDEIDRNGDGYLWFSEFYEHCRVDKIFFGLLKSRNASPRPRPPAPLTSADRAVEEADVEPAEPPPVMPSNAEWERSRSGLMERRRRELEEARSRAQTVARKTALEAQVLKPLQPPQTPLGEAMVAVHLWQYEPGMIAQGYVLLEDLVHAEEEDLEELEDILCLRTPERRRLREMTAAAGRPEVQKEKLLQAKSRKANGNWDAARRAKNRLDTVHGLRGTGWNRLREDHAVESKEKAEKAAAQRKTQARFHNLM